MGGSFAELSVSIRVGDIGNDAYLERILAS
jgi:hypothetical protein